MMSRDRTSRGRAVVRRALVGLAVLAAALAAAGCIATVETSWAPDGTAIAYAPDGELRVYDLETKQSRLLDTGTDWVLSPAWSPDAKAVAFYAWPQDYKRSARLGVIDLTSGQVRTLVPDVWRWPGGVGPDRSRQNQKRNEEKVNEARAASWFILSLYAAISWSPDGKRLACIAGRGGREPTVPVVGADVLLVDATTGAAKPIIRTTGAVTAVEWAPGDSRLAYVLIPPEPLKLERDGKQARSATREPPALWLYGIATGVSAKVCDLPGEVVAVTTRLAWSRDSQQIGLIAAGTSGAEASGYIVAARPGALPREELKGITTAAAWSPGLTGAAFLEERENDEVVVLYRGARPVTRRVLGAFQVEPLFTFNGEPEGRREEERTAGPYSLPQFSPDGRKVAVRIGETAEKMRVAVFPVD